MPTDDLALNGKGVDANASPASAEQAENTDASPVDPVPIDTNHVDPVPVDPVPVDPTPVDNGPTEAVPTEAVPTDAGDGNSANSDSKAGQAAGLASEFGTTADLKAPESAGVETDWVAEIRGIFWLILAVLGFHSFIAKPFFIPSESMLPGLLVGDHLIVTKYPYGYSYISPTFHVLPFFKGRLFGRVPERGDIVVAVPPGSGSDYIKRVIGLPGDRLEVRDGVVILNGVPVKRGPIHYIDIPDYGGDALAEGGVSCDPSQYPGALYVAADGTRHCRLPLVTETLPNGRSYDTVELGLSDGDNRPPVTIPPHRVFLMGDNRDRSADSRFSVAERGLGGPVPWENLGGRAEFITHSFDGKASWNPFSWWGSLRGGRAGGSLHAQRASE